MKFQGVSMVAGDGTELRYNCPFCHKKGKSHDTELKLYVHSCNSYCTKCSDAGRNLNGTYWCHRCKTFGSLNRNARTGGFNQERRPELDELLLALYPELRLLEGLTIDSVHGKPSEVRPEV